MRLADRLELPAGYTARPYDGPADHPAMVAVLTDERRRAHDGELPTVEHFDLTYADLRTSDAAADVALVEHDTRVVAYSRASAEDVTSGRDCVVFTPIVDSHLAAGLYTALVQGSQRHMRKWATGRSRYRAYAPHPGPGRPPTGPAAWLEALGYEATEWSAQLVRRDLDDVPERPLPDGVEVRPVTDDQVRAIVDAHLEAFRGEWDFREPDDADVAEIVEDPDRDISLWQVAWAGDRVVGQVKPYVNAQENEARGRRRGYTEEISTHHDWRNRGIAGALLARSLRAIRDRGMTEASLGVDTNNPGGAFQLYTSLGFEVDGYEAVYTRPVD